MGGVSAQGHKITDLKTTENGFGGHELTRLNRVGQREPDVVTPDLESRDLPGNLPSLGTPTVELLPTMRSMGEAFELVLRAPKAGLELIAGLDDEKYPSGDQDQKNPQNA